MIQLVFRGFATHLDTKRINTVRHKNTVFHDLLKLIPWATFDRLVDEHDSDALARTFKSRDQLIALLYGQLAGAQSLREIIAGLSSHQARLYHIGVKVPPRSTFADANKDRSYEVFSGLFAHMLGMAAKGLQHKIGDAVRLIDSTGLRLAGVGTEWARFSADVCGAKAHIIYDPDIGRPVYHAVTSAKVNDITAAKAMPIEAGATYVFDLGYYDFAWWAKLDAQGCRIVTRFKANTPLVEARNRPLVGLTQSSGPVLSDRIGFLPRRQAMNRKNPMGHAVREIRVQIETGKHLRILTNDLDAPAQEIADLYKRRWQIELFFRFVKQTLKIRHFIGHSENAVRIQIAVALIAFLLLRLSQQMSQVKHGNLLTFRLIRSNLMHRKDFTKLNQIQHPPPLNPRQLTLDLLSI